MSITGGMRPRSRVHELGRMGRMDLMARLAGLASQDTLSGRVIHECMPGWSNERIIDKIIELERQGR
jgi:hypothetical protein